MRNIYQKNLSVPLFILMTATVSFAAANQKWSIRREGDACILNAGNLQRIIAIDGTNVSNQSFKIGRNELLSKAASEIQLTLSKAQPNRGPQRIENANFAQDLESSAAFGSTDTLGFKGSAGKHDSKVQWINAIALDSVNWSGSFDNINTIISQPRAGVHRLILRVRSIKQSPLQDVSISIVYEIYQGHPAIRQWVEVTNNSPFWRKIDRLTLAAAPIGNALPNDIPLTPDVKDAVASIRAFTSSDQTFGLIAGSEIPSAVRDMDIKTGIMSYSENWFEWVLAPAETFGSEAVSYYAFQGAMVKTVSTVSTPLDRCVEGPYQHFLDKYIGVMANRVNLRAPRYCTWSNYAQHITGDITRKIIPLAAQCGFDTFQIDDGWQYDRHGTEPHPEKFADFDEICKQVSESGMTLALWVSSFRSPDSKDIKALPDAFSLPLFKRLTGYGMSFASDWRKYYAQDLVYLRDRYGACYFKQDFTNIKLGDLAASHLSRTLKESHLQGLRGLLESQSLIHQMSPDITTQLSHEIYWGTPGVPCDLAVMKHAAFYHIPPNEYLGLGPIKYRKTLVSEYADKTDPKKTRGDLLKGCFNARKNYYTHRGLPMHMLEHYGAVTANVKGALTTAIQDRQICSFLMGAPVIYSGDLLSLSKENIERYRKRFDQVKRLQKQYDIYRHFQYSGVPAPTDTDWHWWGKLNEDSEGVVIVLRGSAGDDKRKINIPWVLPEKSYKLKTLFGEEELGTFAGSDLINGALDIALPKYGQEILEVKRK